MGVPTSEVGYTPAMPRREDHEVHKDMWWHWGGGGHVVALDKEKQFCFMRNELSTSVKQNQCSRVRFSTHCFRMCHIMDAHFTPIYSVSRTVTTYIGVNYRNSKQREDNIG